MNNKKTSTVVIVLIIAILINLGIYVFVNKTGIGNIGKALEEIFNVKIVENSALEDEISDKQKEESTQVSSNLKIHYIDVGQGDSILIENENKYMLIDAGPTSAKLTVQKYLEKLNIKKIDYLVITHNHEDHIGGMANIIKNFDIGKIIMSKEVATTKVYENMIKAAKEKNLKFYAPKVLEEFKVGEAKAIILANGENDYEDVNNHSIVIKLEFGNNSFVFMGDAEKEVEEDILNSKINVEADVLKLGHHGSYTSSSKAFIEAVKPKYAIVSCGVNNSYGHPCKSTMNIMQKEKIKVYRTDESSNIILESDGKNISFNVKEGSYSYISGK